jgi:hypothetical protein
MGTSLLILPLVAITFGVFGAVIGASKEMAGRGLVLGALLGPLGLVIIALLKPRERPPFLALASCPACGERVRAAARSCRSCGRELHVYRDAP